MVSLYESSQINTTSIDGVLILRPEETVRARSAADGLAVFSSCVAKTISPRADIRPCQLEFFCLGQVISGGGWLWTEGGGRASVSSGQLFFISPGQVHDVAAGQSGMVIDQIFFCGVLADAMATGAIAPGGVQTGRAARQLLPLIEHAALDTPEHRLRAVPGLADLLADLTLGSEAGSLRPEECQVDRLCSELKRKPEQWWDGAQMAAFCNCSESHLRRLFKTRTGLSPKAYQDQIRVEKAEELLKTGFSVRMVSEILGYSDPYHFSRRFKSILGYSPRDSRSR